MSAGIERDWLHVATIGPGCANSVCTKAMEVVLPIAARYGIRPGDIFAEVKHKPACAARHEAILAVHDAFPLWSLPQLGRFFRRDHSTIHHHLKIAGRRP